MSVLGGGLTFSVTSSAQAAAGTATTVGSTAAWWLRLLGTPVLPLGPVIGSVQCTTCHGRYGVQSLEQLTGVRLSAMLRDAQYTVALAVLAAAWAPAAAAPARRPARSSRTAGFEDCGEAQVLAALAALSGLGGELHQAHGLADGLAVELHAALEPLTPHLAQQGRERLLLQGAWIALADGRYLPQEREALTEVGRCLGLGEEQVGTLLEAATRAAH